MLELENTVKPIADGMKWLVTLTAAEIKNVKDETQQLLGHLSASLVGLWEVTQEVSKLSDQDFKTGFPAVYQYFKKFYYDPKALEQVRTHCSDLKRDEGRISFKLSKFLRTDIGKWKEADQKLQLSLFDDASYIGQYQNNFELLNARLNEIHGLLNQGNDADALAAYRRLKTDLSGDLDHLNKYIKNMRDADKHIREIVG